MSTFTPPSDEYGQTVSGKHPLNRLMSYYGTMPRGRNVYYWSDGSVSESDPDSISTFWTAAQGSPYVVQVWWGSTDAPYEVTAAQAAALVSAGYSVT